MRQQAPHRRGHPNKITLVKAHPSAGQRDALQRTRSPGKAASLWPVLSPLHLRVLPPSRTNKRFTLAEANKSLPYVSRVVKDLVVITKTMTTLQQRIEKKGGKDRINAEKELSAAKDRLQTLTEELAVVGAQIKDARSGLIDFIGRHKGHDVCLCWRLGEANVGFFHEVELGFAARQSVAALQEQD